MRAKKYFWHIFFSLVLFLLPFLHFSDRLVPSTFNDEFGYWLGASLFTKYDWSLVGTKIPYYSYGYGMILAPIYNFFDDPIIIYRIAIALNGLWLIGSYFCLFKLISSMYEYIDIRFVKVTAFVCTLYASNIMMVNYTLPEVFLFFAFSLETYLIYMFCKEYKFVYCLYSIILGVFLLMVHQRTLFILISIAAIMFIVSVK